MSTLEQQIAEMQNKIDELHKRVTDLEKQVIQKNARGAGRKKLVEDDEILRLKTDENMKIADIAKKLNVSELTVKRASKRARTERRGDL